MNFFRWVQSHARSVIFILTVLALGGLAASFSFIRSMQASCSQRLILR